MAEQHPKRKPIRGGLAGLLLGIGATLMIILYDVPVPGDLVLISCVVLSVVVGLFAPARGAKGQDTTG